MTSSAKTDNKEVVFIQDQPTPQEGIMTISALLKGCGFSTDVFSITAEGKAIIDNIVKVNPRIIGACVMTPTYKPIMKVLSAVKQRCPDVFVIIGGPHPTFFPDVIFEEKDLNAVCIGEGEYAMRELAISLREGKSELNIRNLWVKRNGIVVKNELCDLTDLDSLPLPDRNLYYEKYPFLFKETIKFMTGRGCPYDCSYCFNKGMRDLYKGKGCWLRFKSSVKIIEEIKTFKEKWPIKIEWISFIDDTFNADKKRLREFLEIYKREVDIPFICQLRIDSADEEQIELLKQAKVDKITVGIEHGDEQFRKKILNRHMSNRQILDFCNWVHQRKIRLFTQNILGFPGETLDLAFSTIDLNTKVKPELAMSHILTPYPGTEIFKYAKDNGYLGRDFNFKNITAHNSAISINTNITSEINNKNKNELLNLRCFFMMLVRHPWLKPLVKILIKLPHNRFYEAIWQVTGIFRTTWRYADWEKRKTLVKKLVLLVVKR